MNHAAVIPQSLSQKSDVALLSEIGLAEHFPEDAATAFEEFFRRHAGLLFAQVSKWISSCEVRKRTLDPQELVSETMERAYRRAATYEDKSSGEPELAVNQVRAWLFRIAQNIGFDAQRRPATQFQAQMVELPPEELLEDVDPPDISPSQIARVNRVLETFSEMDRDIILTCIAYRAYGDTSDALPDEVRKDLIAKYDIAPATFRKRKSRAFERLRQLLS